MTIRDMLSSQFLWLIVALMFFVGYVAFATGSMVTAWDLRDNPRAEYIDPTQWAQLGLKGTFGGDL